MKSFYFCSEECKYSSNDYHSSKRKLKSELKSFRIYLLKVQKLTERELKKKGGRLKNLDLRGRKHGFSVDHKFSVYEGFKNNVDPKIISNINNLEMIEQYKNWSKNSKSTITLDKLLNLIEKENGE